MSSPKLVRFWPIALIGILIGLYSSYKSIINDQIDFLILSLIILIASVVFLFLLKSELKCMIRNRNNIFKYLPMFLIVSLGIVFFIFLFSKNV